MTSNATAATVLYVEDEEFDLLFMRRAFEQAGLGDRLSAVGNGQEAIDYLSGTGAYADRARYPLPTVLLLDVNLPRVSGFEVLRWLRGQPGLEALPVVILSSSAREEDELQARALRVADYLEKPKSGIFFGRVVDRIRTRWLEAPGAAAGQHDSE